MLWILVLIFSLGFLDSPVKHFTARLTSVKLSFHAFSHNRINALICLYGIYLTQP